MDLEFAFFQFIQSVYEHLPIFEEGRNEIDPSHYIINIWDMFSRLIRLMKEAGKQNSRMWMRSK